MAPVVGQKRVEAAPPPATRTFAVPGACRAVARRVDAVGRAAVDDAGDGSVVADHEVVVAVTVDRVVAVAVPLTARAAGDVVLALRDGGTIDGGSLPARRRRGGHDLGHRQCEVSVDDISATLALDVVVVAAATDPVVAVLAEDHVHAGLT